jgi:hypothetical protein
VALCTAFKINVFDLYQPVLEQGSLSSVLRLIGEGASLFDACLPALSGRGALEGQKC